MDRKNVLESSEGINTLSLVRYQSVVTGFLERSSDGSSVGMERSFSLSRASHRLVKFLESFSMEACGVASVAFLPSRSPLRASVLFCQQLFNLTLHEDSSYPVYIHIRPLDITIFC